MRYLLMIHADEAAWADMPPAQQAEEMSAYFAYTQSLRAAGKYVDGSQLQPTSTAQCVHVDAGARRVVDGPFTDTKEALGGYYLIEAESQDDALLWAAKCPGARHGTIEVRPLVAY